MYVYGAGLFLCLCSDCVGVCGNVCCVAAVVKNSVPWSDEVVCVGDGIGCCVFCLYCEAWSCRCSCMGRVFRHADVVCLCLVCILWQFSSCVLHDMQFVNAGRGCNRRPYRRGILQSRSHNCHECLLVFTPSCCSECFYDL